MRNFLLAFFVLWFLPFVSEAATLALSPSNTDASVGGIVRVNVLVSSPNQSVNAISGVVSFPKDKLQLTSISKEGSIINLWATEPTFSNAQGTASFEGVILNGFNGTGGRVVTMSFKVISIGEAPIVFSTASVLASDGQGTNVLNSTSNTLLTLSSPVPVQENNAKPVKIIDTSSKKDIIKSEEKQEEVIEIKPDTQVDNKPEVVVVGALDMLGKYRELGLRLMDAFSITIALGCIVFTFLCFVWYARLRMLQIRKRVKKELGIVDYSMHKAFTQLHAEVTSHVNNIKKAKTKRDLTAEEAVFMDRFEHRLSHIESMLNNEMDRIEKDMGKL